MAGSSINLSPASVAEAQRQGAPALQTLTSVSLSEPVDTDDRLPILQHEQTGTDLESLLFEPRPDKPATTGSGRGAGRNGTSPRSRTESLSRFSRGSKPDVKYSSGTGSCDGSKSSGCCGLFTRSKRPEDVTSPMSFSSPPPGSGKSGFRHHRLGGVVGAGTSYVRWSEDDDQDSGIECWRDCLKIVLCWPCLLCCCCFRAAHATCCCCDVDEDECPCVTIGTPRHNPTSQAAMLQQIEMEARETVLTKACHDGNAMQIADLLAHEDPNKPNSSGDTPLIIASSHGRADLVQQLLEAGADPNGRDIQGYTVLMRAAESGSVDVTHELLEAGADATAKVGDGATALYMAARAGRSRVMDELISHLVASRQFGFVDAVLRSSLRKARRMGLEELSLRLVRCGANLNGQDRAGVTPLMLAAQQGLSEVVAEMLSLGASVSMVSRFDGDTALTQACSHAHHFKKYYQLTVRLLIAAGSDVRHRTADFSLTPVAYAVHAGNADIVEQLLAAGADPNHTDGEGFTPLIRSLGSTDQSQHVGNRTRLAVALLAGGADPNLADCRGRTPLRAVVDRATAVTQTEILVALLLQAGASRQKRDVYGQTVLAVDSPTSSHHQLLASYVPSLKLQAAAGVRSRLRMPVAASIRNLGVDEELQEFLKTGFLDGLLPALEAAELTAQQVSDRSSTYLGDTELLT